MSIQLGQFGVSERLILCRCLLRPMCPVMMHIAYSCTIPRAIVKVVCKYSKRLLVVVAQYEISMCVSVGVPSCLC